MLNQKNKQRKHDSVKLPSKSNYSVVCQTEYKMLTGNC